MSSASTVVVTGASGLLGRAVMARLKDFGAWKQIVGTAFSRSGEEPQKFINHNVFLEYSLLKCLSIVEILK